MGDILDDILGNDKSVKSGIDDTESFENNSLDLYEQLSDPVAQPSPTASKDEEVEEVEKEDTSHSEGEKEGDWGSGDDSDRIGGVDVGGEELRDEGTFLHVTEDSAPGPGASTTSTSAAGEDGVDNPSHDENYENDATNAVETGTVGSKRQWGTYLDGLRCSCCV